MKYVNRSANRRPPSRKSGTDRVRIVILTGVSGAGRTAGGREVPDELLDLIGLHPPAC